MVPLVPDHKFDPAKGNERPELTVTTSLDDFVKANENP
jgi:hypothetical protein